MEQPAAHIQSAASPSGAAASLPTAAAALPAAATAAAAVPAGPTGLRPLFAGTDARRHFDATRWREAAAAFAAWIDAHPGDPDLHRARFLRHFSEHRAGLYGSAMVGLASLAKAGGPLADHERLWAAEAASLGKQPAQAIALLSAIGSDFVRADRAQVLLAQAHTALGDGAAALAAWRELLTRGKDLDSGVLNEAGAALAAARDVDRAATALREVRARFPGSNAETTAERLLATLPAAQRELTAGEHLQRMDTARRQQRRPIALAEAAHIKATHAPGSAPWCRAATVEARVVETFFNRRPEAMALYTDAVKRCPKTAAWAKLWYRAGIRQNSTGTGAAALATFQLIEDKAPRSTLVDDAVRWQALIHRQAGRDKKADALLNKVIGLGGDMGEYASWDLLWHHYQARRWVKAAEVARVAMAARRVPGRVYNRGRLGYWLGRAEARRGKKGRQAAMDAWADVVREHPLTWYGWLARLRLQAMAPKVAAQAWQDARSERPVGELLAANTELLSDRHLLAGVELMRLGLTTSAAQELAAVPFRRFAKKGEPKMIQALLYHAVGQHNRGTALAMGDHEYDTWWPAGPNLERWLLSYPRPPAFSAAVAETARVSGVDPSFIWAIMRSESRFNPRIQSPVLATGLLQLMLPTGRKMASDLGLQETVNHETLKQPTLNIRLGVGYMKLLLGRLGGHYALVASGYNAGPHNTRKWLKKRKSWELDEFVEAIPFRENRRYVKGVLTSALRYGVLYADGAAPDLPLRLP